MGLHLVSITWSILLFKEAVSKSCIKVQFMQRASALSPSWSWERERWTLITKGFVRHHRGHLRLEMGRMQTGIKTAAIALFVELRVLFLASSFPLFTFLSVWRCGLWQCRIGVCLMHRKREFWMHKLLSKWPRLFSCGQGILISPLTVTTSGEWKSVTVSRCHSIHISLL